MFKSWWACLNQQLFFSSIALFFMWALGRSIIRFHDWRLALKLDNFHSSPTCESVSNISWKTPTKLKKSFSLLAPRHVETGKEQSVCICESMSLFLFCYRFHMTFEMWVLKWLKEKQLVFSFILSLTYYPYDYHNCSKIALFLYLLS